MRGFARITLSLLLALVLLPVGQPAAPAAEFESQSTRYAGTWEGKTAQDRLIRFRVSSTNRVRRIVVGYLAEGGGCQIGGRATLRDLRAKIAPDGDFKVRREIGNTTVVVRGTMLSALRAKGTLKVAIVDNTGFGCDAVARTTWRARHQ
jgi:hypothetical protein